MKRLLLSFTTLLLTLATFAQVPPNDLIENATEITAFDFVDENLRLGLATAGGESAGGCPVDNYELIHYKFTATTTGTVFFNITNQDNTEIDTNSPVFIHAYSSPNLNASYSDLTMESGCSIGNTNITLNFVEGQSYYIFVYRSGFYDVSKFSATLLQDVPALERQTLIDLYNATDGPNWTTNTNWNTDAFVETWHGVTVVDGHVTDIALSNNGLLGTLPTSVTNLIELSAIAIANNELYGEIPDFSVLPNLEGFILYNNNFSFQDLEAHFTENSTLSTFSYNPQNPIDEELNIDAEIGNDYSFSMTPVLGTDVQYQWYRGYIYESGTILPEQTTNSLNLVNVQDEDLDTYHCFATSSSVPDLIIKRATIDLKGPVSETERDALIAFYNATGGENWGGTYAENWNTSATVSTWNGVTTAGNKVVVLSRQSVGLTGQLPETLGDLTNLVGLYIGLGDYNLTGSIPESIGNLTQLKKFWIQATSMTGQIPESIGGLVSLTEIRMLGNNFTGPLPESIGNLTQLTNLTLYGGDFGGYGSDFSGVIPTSLGNLVNLQTVNLAENNFEGVLPSSLSNLTNLQYFDMNSNNLYGELPFNSPNANIDISNNRFNFSDMEPFVQEDNYNTLTYSPQRTQDLAEFIESGVGVNITLNVNDTDLGRSENDNAENNSYQWFKDSVLIPGATGTDYIIYNAQETDSGDYHCEITNDVLPDLIVIREPITVVVDSSLSVLDFDQDHVSIYPNPTKNWLNIKTATLTDAKLSIYDFNGRLVFEQSINGNINALNIEALQNGTYILKIKQNDAVVSKRFIKQ
ncbi:T9SS type A sorting domain-containing protein [Winogradskyella helgolandensis]|uniref:T9SS type A sorting domain-containing protein n=1 Tax=Winogradskyella helgolandensis TaxID=2697010 RepID=UPI0015CC3066|nr:T9SS type A sorting domain-containing protein [Winogradskyella helgolandensis]